MLIGEVVHAFMGWCSRRRSAATVGFYQTRHRWFCREFNARDLATLTPLEIDEYPKS
jgi:hypothetical protein